MPRTWSGFFVLCYFLLALLCFCELCFTIGLGRSPGVLHGIVSCDKMEAQNDVLSLNSSSESEFSGFHSDDLPSNKKTKKPSKTVKSVVSKVNSGKKGKSQKSKSSSKEKEDSCMVQIDLNNLNDNTIELLKQKLGLLKPSNVPQPSSSRVYDDDFQYGDDEFDERVDLNSAPNIHVELTNETDTDDDSIGVRKRPKSKKRDMSNKLLNELFGTDNSDKENESDWELPKIKKKSKGLPVSQSLAKLVNTACTTLCDTDSIIEKYSVPENCEMLNPPAVNGEIWKILDKRSRSYDRLFQEIQQSLAAGMVPVLKLVDILKSQISSNEEAKHLISDCLTMLGQVQYNLSIRRRYLIRPNINKKYRNLCNVGTPVTTLLFGDDITKEMKNCDTGLTLGSNLSRDRYSSRDLRGYNRARYPRNYRARGRYMPYGQTYGGTRGVSYGGYGRGQRRPMNKPTATVSSAPNGGN